MNLMTFHSVGNVIIPTDELIFFRGVGIPPTSHGRWPCRYIYAFLCSFCGQTWTDPVQEGGARCVK